MISPPSNSYPAATQKTLTPAQQESLAEHEARYAAYLATPEGQAEVAAKARREEESWERLEAFVKGADTDENDSSGGPKSKKHGKLFAKHPPKKGTGGLLGLLAKVTKKG